jgi:uncharacterized protein YkwD
VVEETIEYLQNSSTGSNVTTSNLLELAAMDHVADMAQNNLLGHTSSDGRTTKDRIEKHCRWRVSVGENIDFGSSNATDVIVNLLIDDGVPSRGHRLNIMNPGLNSTFLLKIKILIKRIV